MNHLFFFKKIGILSRNFPICDTEADNGRVCTDMRIGWRWGSQMSALAKKITLLEY